MGLKDGQIDSNWKDGAIIDEYKTNVSKYYGCYGAILEVAIKPSGLDKNGKEFPLSEYPYFTDFEPKKRELYELVSETGETMSHTLEGISVQKSGTTSQSSERVDIFGGFSQSGEVNVMGSGGGAAYSQTGEWGIAI